MNTRPAPKRRPARRRHRWLSGTTRAVLLWALLMAPLLWWGLPSSQRDDLLFGQRPPWKAARYNVDADLRELSTRNAGADTDLDPLTNRDSIIDLTADDAARAEILRRYRLFSRQPDEMIIFRALQRMSPRQLDFDPRLYQYGGGYIYLIGAGLAAAALLGLVHLTGDIGVYLEHPESFAGFYLVARFLSLVFGALTLIAVNKLARRAGGRSAGWIAMLCVACCPVFITAVLEAKPHLPSACLIMWAILSGLDYHARGRWQDAWRMGLQAGYALGLVLTGIVAALLWPALLIMRPAASRRQTVARLTQAAGLALLVYVLSNPYVPYNWLANPGALSSNIRNSTAMYQHQIRHAPQGAVRVGELLVESAGAAIPVAGTIGLLLLLRRRPAATTIAAASGLGMLVIGVLLGAGKPAEFARFLILPVLLLSVATAWLLAALARRRLLLGILAALVVLGVMPTPAYLRAFIDDARGHTESRLLAGRYLQEHMASDDVLGLLQEPAPYAVPPFDFAHRRAALLPATSPPDHTAAQLPAWLVFTDDDDRAHADAWWRPDFQLDARFPRAGTHLARITWANKPVFIYRRAH